MALLMTAVQADVSGFMEGLREHGVESRSIARKLSCLRGFYRWLLMDKRIAHDPTVNIETPASWKVLPKSLAESEVAEMLERTGVRLGRRMRMVWRCGIMRSWSCCMRAGCGWGRCARCGQEDLHLDQARAQVRGKGDKERIVPLGEKAVEALEAYLQRGRPELGLAKVGCSGRCF
jgi:integrase/recombinase XerD